MLSKKLATIVLDVPITLDIDACQTYDYDRQKATDFFENLGFRSMIGRLPAAGVDAKEAEEVFAEMKEEVKKEDKPGEQVSLFK